MSIINDQQVSIEQLITPQVVSPLSSPTLTPLDGSLSHDASGNLYYGDGTIWNQITTGVTGSTIYTATSSLTGPWLAGVPVNVTIVKVGKMATLTISNGATGTISGTYATGGTGLGPITLVPNIPSQFYPASIVGGYNILTQITSDTYDSLVYQFSGPLILQANGGTFSSLLGAIYPFSINYITN